MAKYICRLVMKVEADDPSEAPVTFVNFLVEAGLITWIYRVEDPDTGEILGYFDGNGELVDMDEIIQNQDEDQGDEEDQTPIETVSLPDVTGEGLEVSVTTSATPSDDELVAYAESLNEADSQ